MPSLSSIPPELQLHISEYLGYEALGRLNQTSKYFNALLDDEMLSRACKEPIPDKVKQALHYAVGFNAADRIRNILWRGKKSGLDLVNMKYERRFIEGIWDTMDRMILGETPLEHAFRTKFDLPDMQYPLDYDDEVQGATREVDLGTIELLIDEGADVNAQRTGYGKWAGPVLLRAISMGRIDIVQLLLDRGVSSFINATRRSVLHWAISKRSDLETFRLLLVHGADVQAKATGGMPPLHTALEFEDFDKAALLLEWGAKINNKDGQARSPLMCAAEDRRVEGVKWLLERRADVQAKNKKGTAETIAMTCKTELEDDAADWKNEYEVIIQLLKKRRLSCEESEKKDEEFMKKQRAGRARR